MENEIALFSKSLTLTDIRKRLSMPMKILSNLPPFTYGCHAMDLLVEDEKGKRWSMRCIVRRKGHKKPVLSKGWKKFVDKNNLNTGDQVTFLKKQGMQLPHCYKIQVKKPVKVFGTVVGYAPSTRIHTN